MKTTDLAIAEGADEALIGSDGRAGENVKVRSTARMPSQIKYIVGNEACERFSYYGMRTILLIYMTQYLMMQKNDGTAIYHSFVSACYLLPLLGGYLSDRYLGKYKTILSLSLVYCLGHAVLAAWPTTTGLYLALSLIALGSGGIKPCVSAHVGDQFNKKNAHLVNRVFDLFYWMINFGAFFSSLLTPELLKRYGHQVAFGIPGVLMLLATIVFWMGRKEYVHVPPTGKNPNSFVAVVSHALMNFGKRQKGQSLLDVAKAHFPEEAVEGAKAALRVGVLFITVSIFWSLFDQGGSTWVLLAKKMDLNFFGYQINEAQIQAINPIMILALIPVFSAFIYPWFEKRGMKVTSLRKMTAGMYVAALSFLVVAGIQYLVDGGAKMHVMWLCVPYIIITIAEILISITGLEFAYTQAPRAMKSTIMSFWLLTVFLGNFVTAVIAKIAVFEGTAFMLFFTGLMLAVSVIFTFQAKVFKVRNYIEG